MKCVQRRSATVSRDGRENSPHTYEMALESITDAEKEKVFKEKWHDRHSSMNDIGSYAHKMAEVLKSQKRGEPT